MPRFPCVLPAALTVLALALTCTSCGTEPFPVRTYGMGEQIILGHLIYNVFETQWMTQLGQGQDARIPQNRFLLVRISETNSGGETLVAPNLVVEDDSGHTFPELSNGDGVPQWAGFLRQIGPAESAAGNLVFDVAPKRYKLRITDEEGRRTALVEIPLTFGTEAPDIPTPDKEKKP